MHIYDPAYPLGADRDRGRAAGAAARLSEGPRAARHRALRGGAADRLWRRQFLHARGDRRDGGERARRRDGDRRGDATASSNGSRSPASAASASAPFRAACCRGRSSTAWRRARRISTGSPTSRWTAARLPEHEAAIARLPGRLMIDHIGKFLEPMPLDHPAVAVLMRLVDSGRTYVKIASPYDSSRSGPPGLCRPRAAGRAAGASARRSG